MLRFATAGFTASKSIINFQHGRSLALFVWPQQSRRYMSNDDARQKGLTETTKSVLAQGVVTAGITYSITITPFYLFIPLITFFIYLTNRIES